jgi:hypothetical protein
MTELGFEPRWLDRKVTLGWARVDLEW